MSHGPVTPTGFRLHREERRTGLSSAPRRADVQWGPFLPGPLSGGPESGRLRGRLRLTLTSQLWASPAGGSQSFFSSSSKNCGQIHETKSIISDIQYVQCLQSSPLSNSKSSHRHKTETSSPPAVHPPHLPAPGNHEPTPLSLWVCLLWACRVHGTTHGVASVSGVCP